MRHLLSRCFVPLLAAALAAGACSSGSETSSLESPATTEAASSQESAATTEETASQDSAAATAAIADDGGFAVSCEEASEASATLRGAAQTMGQLSAETENDISLDYAGVLAAIDVLRPIQDVAGPLGEMRGGLDNLETDVAALQEKRYDDTIGDYGVAAMNGVIGAEIC